MLKRQRSTASFTTDAYTFPELTMETAERTFKRRRQFPPQQFSDKGKTRWRGPDSDGEEDIDTNDKAAGCLVPSEYAQRLEQAGVYKNANTLLHDLHAEQRHRTLFSSSTQPSQLSHHQTRPHPDHPYPAPPTKFMPSAQVPLSVAAHESHRPSSFMISIPSKTAEAVDHVEVQRVTERYEDTNRFLGALFLSRRRQSDDHRHHTQG